MSSATIRLTKHGLILKYYIELCEARYLVKSRGRQQDEIPADLDLGPGP